MQSPLTFIRNE